MFKLALSQPKEVDELKTTIYKHQVLVALHHSNSDSLCALQVDQTYSLKMKASREVFSQITSDHPTLPFSLR